MKQQPYKRYRKLSLAILIATLLPLILYAMLAFQRPARVELTQTLFAGITYQRQIRTTPRAIVIHIIHVDLTAPGIGIIVSPSVDNRPADPTEPTRETVAQTTTEFLSKAQVQIATNGSFFYPFEEKSPWHYYPHRGDRTYVAGQAIASGIPYASPLESWFPVCILDTQRVLISGQTVCPDNSEFALSGVPLLLIDGQVALSDDFGENAITPYARLVAATNATGTELWLIAVDGKQPFYSEGMTLPEVIELLQSLGATHALNLDGGGSTTLVQATPHGPKVLNAPIHTKVPMRERPVANHIGIYAQPLE
ncbi:MAG: phosphodiester glycosidase family protein [Cyanobacteria bacterium J06635_15]